MKPFCSIFELTLKNKSEALFWQDFEKGHLIQAGVSIHIVMRHIISVALVALIGLMMPSFAVAADPVHGEQVFSANCAACHMGAGNVVNGQRTLKQDDLKAYLSDYNDGHESAIVYQVTNGKNGMPAFGSKLGSDDISDVAAYVEAQSAKGWA